MEPEKRLKLGDEINGTVVKSQGGRRFLVKTRDAPSSWKVELHTRRPETIELGSHTTFWVGKINPLKGELLVLDGDFGRLPISDSMGKRYRDALEALMGGEEITGDHLAEARGMVRRLTTQDQADWLSVWRILGEPSSGEAKRLLIRLTALSNVRKESPAEFADLLARFREEFGPRLAHAMENLPA